MVDQEPDVDFADGLGFSDPHGVYVTDLAVRLVQVKLADARLREVCSLSLPFLQRCCDRYGPRLYEMTQRVQSRTFPAQGQREAPMSRRIVCQHDAPRPARMSEQLAAADTILGLAYEQRQILGCYPLID